VPGKLPLIARSTMRRLPAFPNIPDHQGGGLRYPNVRRCAASSARPGMSTETIAFYEDLVPKRARTAAGQKVRQRHRRWRVRQVRRAQAFFAKFEDELSRNIEGKNGGQGVREVIQ